MTMANLSLRFLAPQGIRPGLPLFIYLPGMDGTGTLLRPQLSGLGALFDIRCLSIPPDNLLGWEGMLAQLSHLIKSEKQRTPSRPIVLCGESFGGCLALQLAAYFPHLCDRLILVNPASSASSQSWMGWGASITRWLPDALYRFSTLGLLPLLIARHRVSSSNQEALLRAMQSVTPQTAAWRISMLSEFILERLPLACILQPALVLASGADRILPSVAEARKLFRYLPNLQSVLLPESGHACLLESKIQLARIIQSHDFCRDSRGLIVHPRSLHLG